MNAVKRMINAAVPVGTETKWIRCPNCGAKHSLYSNTAECHGVFLKCTRGCKCEFELIIEKGDQMDPNTQKPLAF